MANTILEHLTTSLPSAELGSYAIVSALDKASVKPDEVSLCIMGQVLYAGEGL